MQPLIQKVGSFKLINSGGFVVRIRLKYIANGTEKWSSDSGKFPVGQSETVDPKNLGVPNGSQVYLSAICSSTSDRHSDMPFIYEEGNPNRANFVITGTIFSKDLGFSGLSQ